MSPPATDDPFGLLGLPRTFRLDQAALRRAHRRLAAESHPDRAGAGHSTADAARVSAGLNEAYLAVAEPVARAETLLRLAGVAASGSEPMPPAFLAEMMEWREATDAAKESGDAAALAALREEAAGRRSALLEQLAARFDAAERLAAEARLAGFQEARSVLNELRYVERWIASLESAEA